MEHTGLCMGESYVTTVEAADALGLGIRTMQRLAQAGEIPVAQKLPGRTGQYLFSRAVIDLLVAQQEEKVS